MKKLLSVVFTLLLCISAAQAQKTHVTLSFDEQFFEALLDAIFFKLKQPEFPLAGNSAKRKVQSVKSDGQSLSFASDESKIQNPKIKIEKPFCAEKVTLLRELNGVRTAVKFRGGQISAPIAFAGEYNPPLLGCIEFRGVADTVIDLEFNQEKQTLLGKIRVVNVNLGGAGNLAGNLIARLVQSSIDRKVNPIEIFKTDKLGFNIPVQNSGGSLKMQPIGIRHELGEGILYIHVDFEFQKAD